MLKRGQLVTFSGAFCVGIWLLAAGGAKATENAVCGTNTTPSCVPTVTAGGPNGTPLVYVIGDSISNLDMCATCTPVVNNSMPNNYIWFNAETYLNKPNLWQTVVVAQVGWTIDLHLEADTFNKALQAGANAIYIELGTNDIGQINSIMVPDASSRAQLFNAVTNAVMTVMSQIGTKTCVVWQGLNEQFDSGGSYSTTTNGPYDDIAWAAKFDQFIRSLSSQYPNLHFANYSQMIATETTVGVPISINAPVGTGSYLLSLAADGVLVHPDTDLGRAELGVFEGLNVHHACGI